MDYEDLKIDKEFQNLLPPLSEQEETELRESLVGHKGALEPIDAWKARIRRHFPKVVGIEISILRPDENRVYNFEAWSLSIPPEDVDRKKTIEHRQYFDKYHGDDGDYSIEVAVSVAYPPSYDRVVVSNRIGHAGCKVPAPAE